MSSVCGVCTAANSVHPVGCATFEENFGTFCTSPLAPTAASLSGVAAGSAATAVAVSDAVLGAEGLAMAASATASVAGSEAAHAAGDAAPRRAAIAARAVSEVLFERSLCAIGNM